MDKAAVIKFRNLAQVSSVTLYSKELNADGVQDKFVVPNNIHIVCDNSLNIIDDNNGSVIWDDANEVFYAFRLNTPSSFFTGQTNTISHGNQPKVPICLIAVDYGEIQNMRFQLNCEQFEKIAQELKLTDEEHDHLYNKFFVNLDQKHQIEVKRTISYDTQTKKDGAIAKRSYDGNDEYMKTVHPVAF